MAVYSLVERISFSFVAGSENATQEYYVVTKAETGAVSKTISIGLFTAVRKILVIIHRLSLV